MKDVLKRVFGAGWEPPRASVSIPLRLNWDL